jgi:hypothetical protein
MLDRLVYKVPVFDRKDCEQKGGEKKRSQFSECPGDRQRMCLAKIHESKESYSKRGTKSKGEKPEEELKEL